MSPYERSILISFYEWFVSEATIANGQGYGMEKVARLLVAARVCKTMGMFSSAAAYDQIEMFLDKNKGDFPKPIAAQALLCSLLLVVERLGVGGDPLEWLTLAAAVREKAADHLTLVFVEEQGYVGSVFDKFVKEWSV